MTAARCQRCSGHQVVAGSREQVQPLVLQAVAILHDSAHGGLAALLRTAQGLVFKGGDAAGLVAR